ncbi:unnamed protein product [Dovyalis caffra]|uniref:RRM domain-containing protein n=1 Tax=Dovyalis caffra TaxID=77055 RepID=A0AAV1R1Z5_9ROSI|nr:unnamed protein product [Dovyalis caffra]
MILLPYPSSGLPFDLNSPCNQVSSSAWTRICTTKPQENKIIFKTSKKGSTAGDEAITELLLKTNIDLNDVHADGRSALHWIMWLPLKHGARVNQKNKLGLTTVHIAASNDQDCINSIREMKETPLFLAAKNDYRDCAELLLHRGASTAVFNLRKQQPVDLAESQDMRFMLNYTDVNLNSLGKLFEEQFGSVDDAVILEVQKADKIKSRGFGYVIFKDKKSVSGAVEAHHVIILTALGGSCQITDDNPEDESPCVNSRYLQFLKPDPIFHARSWASSDFDGGKETAVGERGSGKGFQEIKPRCLLASRI